MVDIGNRYGHAGNFDYANVSVWNPQIFERIPAGKKISFIPIVADWIGQGGKIGGVVLNEGHWFNLGSRAEYLAVHRTIAEGWRPAYVRDRGLAATHRSRRHDRSERGSARLLLYRGRLPGRRGRDDR